MTEAEIAVHWPEEASVPPPAALRRSANVRDPAVRDRFALERLPEAFAEYAELLTWDKPWTRVLDAGRPPFYRWFVGGKLNASVNCLDRHVATSGDRRAFVFQGEREEEPPVAVTFRELLARVNAFAAFLRDDAGVGPGDRVTIHLPMIPELPVSMLACARLGAIHSVVFGGFSGEAAGRRAADSKSSVVITADGYYRNGRTVDHFAQRAATVAAAASDGQAIEKVLVWRREPGRWLSGTEPRGVRDVAVNDRLTSFAGARVEPVAMPSDAPLFLMYTSGTTGRPKGCQHATGGYLAYVAATARAILDLRTDDVYWCLADIGWITGHSYIVYGPLTLGVTGVLYEGVPTHPDAGRPWRIAESLGVSVFHTSPTAIRLLRKLGPDEPARHRQRFRVLATVGEPIEPETWRWYHREVGKGKAAVVDTWWQTETGGFLCSTIPGLDPMKPGSTGPPVPGIHPVVLDDDGNALPAGSGKAGHLCIRNPWPGLMQTIWGDPDRMVREYFDRFNRDPTSTDWNDWPYCSGDGAVQAEDGYVRILGRIDDVINVAGHRLGAKEIESACLTVAGIAEAAVVPVADETKGRVPEVYVALLPGARPDARAIEGRIVRAIETAIGKIARPRAVHVVSDMPKTRSGKIMRRVLAGISNRRDTGDLTTLANPEVVDAIRGQVEGRESRGIRANGREAAP